MPKHRLTKDEYIAELNRQLSLDEQYQGGMEFLPAPPDASGSEMTGYDMAGPLEWRDIYSRVAAKVREKFEVI